MSEIALGQVAPVLRMYDVPLTLRFFERDR